MAQAPIVIANGSGGSVRSAINSSNEAMTTKQGAAGAPSPTYPYMDWADAANDLLKQRNAANSAWITKGTLSAEYNGLAVQVQSAAYTTYNNTNTAVPFDDSIPTNSEGLEILSLSFTPRYATSKIKIDIDVFLGAGAAGIAAAAVLLIDGTAVKATSTSIPANNVAGLTFGYIYQPGDASARTFSCRVGPSAGGTLYINGSNSTRIFGGISQCRLTATELN
jgi:hypothetical protein